MTRLPRLFILAALGLAVLSCSSHTVAVAGTGWRHLGERTVNGRRDIDTIKVGAGKDTFVKLRIDVKGSALEMYNIVVHFGNGEKYSPDTRLTFGKGTESRTLDLPGGARTIEKVVFKYGNLPQGGRAHIVLYGQG